MATLTISRSAVIVCDCSVCGFSAWRFLSLHFPPVFCGFDKPRVVALDVPPEHVSVEGGSWRPFARFLGSNPGVSQRFEESHATVSPDNQPLWPQLTKHRKACPMEFDFPREEKAIEFRVAVWVRPSANLSNLQCQETSA